MNISQFTDIKNIITISLDVQPFHQPVQPGSARRYGHIVVGCASAQHPRKNLLLEVLSRMHQSTSEGRESSMGCSIRTTRSRRWGNQALKMWSIRAGELIQRVPLKVCICHRPEHSHSHQWFQDDLNSIWSHHPKYSHQQFRHIYLSWMSTPRLERSQQWFPYIHLNPKNAHIGDSTTSI